MKTDLKNSAAVSFYKSVKKNLLCSKEQRAVFLDNLEDSLLEYSEKNPDAVKIDFESEFGTPAEIADEFIATIAGKEIRKKIRKSRFVKASLIIIVAVIVAIGVAVFIWNKNTHPEFIYETTEPVSENTNN